MNFLHNVMHWIIVLAAVISIFGSHQERKIKSIFKYSSINTSFSYPTSFQNATVNKMETHFSLKVNCSVCTVQFYKYLFYYSMFLKSRLLLVTLIINVSTKQKLYCPKIPSKILVHLSIYWQIYLLQLVSLWLPPHTQKKGKRDFVTIKSVVKKMTVLRALF